MDYSLWNWICRGHIALPEDDFRATGILASVLVFGLMGLTPVLHLTLGMPLFVGVALTGCIYVLLIILGGVPVLGTIVGLVVTVTVGADLPLTDTAHTYPGDLGPILFLFHGPVLLLGVFGVARGWWKPKGWSRAQILLLGFVVWTVVAAVLGNPPRLDTALFFSLFMCIGWLVFSATRHSITEGFLSTEAVLLAFLVGLAGHSVVGIVQFLTQGPLPLSYLGTGPNSAPLVIWLPMDVTYHVGAFVSGFARRSLPYLLIPATGIALGAALTRPHRERLVAIGLLLLFTMVVRLTGSDAARGGIFIVMTAIIVAWTLRSRLPGTGNRIQSIVPDEAPAINVGLIITLVLVAGILAVPIAETRSLQQAGSGKTQTGDTGKLTTTETTTQQTSDQPSEPSTTAPEERSTANKEDDSPFSLIQVSTLGPRLVQYRAALIVFANNPIFGVGGANFMYVSDSFDLSKEHFRIHNLYLALLAETGLPGFLLYMLFLGAAFRDSVLQYLREGNFLVLACWGGIIGFLAAGVFGTVLDKALPQYSLLLLLGALNGAD